MLVWFIYILGCIDTPKMANSIQVGYENKWIPYIPSQEFLFIYYGYNEHKVVAWSLQEKEKKRKEGDFGRKIKDKTRTNVFHVVDRSHHTGSPLVATLSSSFCSSSSSFFFFLSLSGLSAIASQLFYRFLGDFVSCASTTWTLQLTWFKCYYLKKILILSHACQLFSFILFLFLKNIMDFFFLRIWWVFFLNRCCSAIIFW